MKVRQNLALLPLSIPVLFIYYPREIFKVIFWGLPFAVAAILRNDPNPKFPAVPKPDIYDDEDLPGIYAKYAEKLVENVKVTQFTDADEQGFILKAKGSPAVRYFSYQSKGTSAGIDIAGMGTAYWNTDEYKNLDEFFWISVAALKNGMHKRRSKLGVNEVCVQLDNQDAWYYSTDDDPHFVEYGGYRRHFHD